MVQASYSARDLTRTVLAVLCLGALVVSTVWIILPFLSALLWATTIVISTWPVLLRVEAALGGRRSLATAVMVIALMLVFVIPVTLSVAALLSNVNLVVEKIDALRTFMVPRPPEWIGTIPIVGPQVAAGWQRASTEGLAVFAAQLGPYARQFLEWSARRIGGMGAITLQFLLTVIISAVLYARGEAAGRGVSSFAYRLAGPNGERATILAAATVRAVATGVVVTAVAQSAVAGLGLALASVPAAGLLTAAILICCLAQLGPFLVGIPAVVWKFYIGDPVWASVLLVFIIVAGTMDNFLRPFLIRKGADLPMLLIIAGVIGGMLSFGVMGIFIGPVVLAVSYVLLREWVVNQPPAEGATISGGPSSAASA